VLAVKVLPKGQITLPKSVRDKLSIKVGDTLLIEERASDIVVSRGKTLLDFRGVLPDLGLSIEQIRDKAVTEAIRSRG
jgi:AbrB family looped-hinge helix DNA binding protein